MRKKIWDKRIPTLLGMVLIVLSVGLTTFLVKQGSFFVTNANPSQQPKNVRITNITDNSFTVSYTTDNPVTGSLNYGKSQSLGQVALDSRDQQSVLTHSIHYITASGLTAQTQYFFSIISGQETYLNNNQPFEVTTGSQISLPPLQQDAVSGNIIVPSGNPPNEAVVYLTSDSSQVVSALVKSDGTYNLPLNLLRTSDLSSYDQLQSDTMLKMLAYGDGLISNVTLSYQNNLVPTITLSKDYNFIQTAESVASASANLVSFPSLTSASASGYPKIITPQKDQGFTDQQPLFKGTALPDQNVQVIIHSAQTVQSNISSDTSGYWSYRPSSPLAPGTHTITVITKNAAGILTTLTQSFTVYAAGTQVSQPATPSATLTPTPTSTPLAILYSPSPTPTQTPIPTQTTITPTQTPNPTSGVNQNSSLSASGSETATNSSQILPPTGNPSIMIIGIIGIVISLMGGLLFFFSRGGAQAL